MNTIFKIFFWLKITFFIVVTYSLAIGDNISFEIADRKLRQHFYHFIELGLSVVILLVIFWDQRKSNYLNSNSTIIISTLVRFLIIIFVLVFLLFSFILVLG